MCIITNLYRKNFLIRYDKDDGIPYFSAADFAGLRVEQGTFRNATGDALQYFFYHYDGYDGDKLLLFCPGLGPGHTAYLAEIETLCRAGYRVLTLDYTGCGASAGARLPSVGAPTRDVLTLLDLLRPQAEIIPIGHSLGGYTALSLAHLLPAVKRVVVISGFMDISDEMMGFVKWRSLANVVRRYECRLEPRYGAPDNRAYLATTTDRVLWFHSTDDPMVSYRYNAEAVLHLANPHVRMVTVAHKQHNPQYTAEALATMQAWIGEYNRLVKEKQLATPEARQAYFADKPIARMTEQDPAVYDEILRFISH